MAEQIKPITLHDNEDGTEYVLEFNRESVLLNCGVGEDS